MRSSIARIPPRRRRSETVAGIIQPRIEPGDRPADERDRMGKRLHSHGGSPTSAVDHERRRERDQCSGEVAHVRPGSAGCGRDGLRRCSKGLEISIIRLVRAGIADPADERISASRRAACGRTHPLVTQMRGPRGGVVTQRTANPCTPVRFRARPPTPPHSSLRALSILFGADEPFPGLLSWRHVEGGAQMSARSGLVARAASPACSC